MSKTREPTGRPKKYLSAMSKADHATIEKSLRRLTTEWNADGWAVVGRPPKLRIAVLVPKKLPRPITPATTLQLPRGLGGGTLKVSVIATHRVGAAEATSAPAPLPPNAGTDFLAPGAPIGGDGERIGIGAVVSINGAQHIVTCGHPFSSSGSTITTLDGATEIGKLRVNFFSSGDRLDAALFEVNADGLALLTNQEASRASSWAARFHDPATSDNDSEAVFWPTWTDTGNPFVENVTAYSSCMPATVGCGYLLLPRCTVPGDSGSTLQLDGAYYGLASRRDGNFSFFTPLTSVKRRLEATGSQMIPWRPR